MTGDDAGALADGDTAEKAPFDTSVAHQARMYDYVLGGKDNYAADRAAVEAGLKVWPDMAFAMRANRAFLGRAVRYLAADAGMRQFLDIGTGIPTSGNTHEIVQAIAPQSRVVYVDYDHASRGVHTFYGLDLPALTTFRLTGRSHLSVTRSEPYTSRWRRFVHSAPPGWVPSQDAHKVLALPSRAPCKGRGLDIPRMQPKPRTAASGRCPIRSGAAKGPRTGP
jgi:hypothetical protein